MTKSTGKGKGRWGTEGGERIPSVGPCLAPGCDSQKRWAKGLCQKHYAAARYKENPTRWRKSFLKCRWGLPEGGYEAMLESQGGVCAICGTKPGKRHLCVDHDHGTGSVRALLCYTCNTGIGGLKDDPAVIMKAYDYLKRFGK